MNEIVSTNWNYPTPIWFGLSRRLEIIEALQALTITKPMIVTDPNFAENEDFVDILAILKKSQIEFSVFSNKLYPATNLFRSTESALSPLIVALPS